jgi:hypothetical protein
MGDHTQGLEYRWQWGLCELTILVRSDSSCMDLHTRTHRPHLHHSHSPYVGRTKAEYHTRLVVSRAGMNLTAPPAQIARTMA